MPQRAHVHITGTGYQASLARFERATCCLGGSRAVQLRHRLIAPPPRVERGGQASEAQQQVRYRGMVGRAKDPSVWPAPGSAARGPEEFSPLLIPIQVSQKWCGWQVLGSNQRRLRRRFYRPLPLSTRATCLGVRDGSQTRLSGFTTHPLRFGRVREQWAIRDSNPGPTACDTAALPLS